MRRSLLAPLAAILLLAACGDDDGGDDAAATSDGATAEVSDELQPYADALATSFTADDIADDFAFTDENAECVAAESVEVVGIDRLEAVGTPDEVITATTDDLAAFDLTQPELDRISEAFLDCVDDSEALLEDAFLEGAQLNAEQSQCVADLVDRELLVRILSAGIGGQDPEAALADVQSDFLACA